MPRKKKSDRHELYFDDDFDANDDTNSQSSKNDYPPEQRNAANLRERARMRVLSGAFGRLKTKLPNIPADTKLSKLDTLRLAIIYIKQLKGALGDGGGVALSYNFETNSYLSAIAPTDANTVTQLHNTSGISTTMSWPFGFHQQPFVQQDTATTAASSTSSNSCCSSNHNNQNNNNNNHHNQNHQPHQHHPHHQVELYAKYAFNEPLHNQSFYQLDAHQSNHQQHQQYVEHHNHEQQQQQEVQQHHEQQQQQQQRIYYRHKPN